MIKKGEFKKFARACRKDIVKSPTVYSSMHIELVLSAYDAVITLLVKKLDTYEQKNHKGKITKKTK